MPAASKITSLDAATALLFHVGRQLRGGRESMKLLFTSRIEDVDILRGMLAKETV